VGGFGGGGGWGGGGGGGVGWGVLGGGGGGGLVVVVWCGGVWGVGGGGGGGVGGVFVCVLGGGGGERRLGGRRRIAVEWSFAFLAGCGVLGGFCWGMCVALERFLLWWFLCWVFWGVVGLVCAGGGVFFWGWVFGF